MEAIIILSVLLALSIALNVALCLKRDTEELKEQTDYEKMVENEKQDEIHYLKHKLK